LVENFNELVDICNGRSTVKGMYTAYYTPETADAISEKLLSILSWFSDWEKCVEDDPKLTEHNFLSRQTWNGIQRLILGTVAMIQHYVKKGGATISPRATTSDPCENHFANTRANCGSTNSPTCTMAVSCDKKAGAYAESSRVIKANNAAAPPLFQRHNY
jgi:hypothetical protein